MQQRAIQLQVGFELLYDCPQPVPMILLVNMHYSRAADIVVPDLLTTDPFVPVTSYRDAFGNWCSRLIAPVGRLRLQANGVVRDTGQLEQPVPGAVQHSVEELPEETLVFLLGSRYCDTDLLSDTAWQLFASTPPGWARVQAICDYVHERIEFGYPHACAARTAHQGHSERKGVCRDFAHLAVTFCRCMNIPARYCTGYLGDIGVPAVPDPMDFSAWFEAYLGGRWYTFDARHNHPRIGRILMARGRDATDVAISTSFGNSKLVGFKVITDEVIGEAA